MKERALLRTGIVGTIVVAVCCFTPVLVVLFSVLGLSAVIGYLDLVLFSTLAVFLGLTVYAFWRKQCRVQQASETGGN